MNDVTVERLVGCFEKVFPDLSKGAIPGATHETIAAWDSVAQITLFSLIGEEFGFEINFEDFEGATSFTAILELVRAKVANA